MGYVPVGADGDLSSFLLILEGVGIPRYRRGGRLPPSY